MKKSVMNNGFALHCSCNPPLCYGHVHECAATTTFLLRPPLAKKHSSHHRMVVILNQGQIRYIIHNLCRKCEL